MAQSTWIPVVGEKAQTRIAAARFSDGTRIVARCDAGILTAFIRGAEAFSGDAVFVLTTRAEDPPRGDWSLTSQDNLNVFARSPGEFVRDLRQGGAFNIIVKSRDAADREMALDLPLDTSALDAVMTDCDVPLQPSPARQDFEFSVSGKPPPSWSKPPTPLSTDYPATALRRNLSGNARINCLLARRGRLENCFVIDEAPARQGFGAAAIAIVLRGEIDPSEHTFEGGIGPAVNINIPMSLNDRPAPRLPFADRVDMETEGLFSAATAAPD